MIDDHSRLAYAKIQTGDAVLHSGLPDDPALEQLLSDYFPAPLRRRFPAALSSHPLRREIVATALTNRAVNVAGITGLFRLAEETGVPLTGGPGCFTSIVGIFETSGISQGSDPFARYPSVSTMTG